MQEKILQLEERIKALEEALNFTSMPFTLKEIIRNEVIEGIDTISPTTTAFNLTGNVQTINVSKTPLGILVLKSRGKEYKIPYI